MRPIKFRAWDKGHPGFKPSGMVFDIEKGEDFDSFLNDQQWDVMQFTGLLDKNGKEIYEGDIVRGGEGYADPTKGIVEYSALAFCYVGKTEAGERWIDTITNPDIKQDFGVEVIGNIYENPDLLTGAKRP